MKYIRVRIAPSPTGNLHIGTARTALFNYLYAKKRNGVFVLRIEDTDLERSDRKFEKNIIDGLKWLGLSWDEGPDNNKYIGNYAPYRQSERTAIYREYIKKLLDDEKAYHCFCTKEELEIERDNALKAGKAPIYSGKCRNLSKRDIEDNLKGGKKSIIRFKVPDKIIEFNDSIRGKLSFETKLFGDLAIAKDINTPLYNLAVVIDDITMDISHVIRGEDHIPNTPKQILFYEAFKVCHPMYAHLPLILGPDKTKLSKRHGATSVIEYQKQGYLPEAMVNFMAMLGWNPKDNREYFSLKDLGLEFDLTKVNRSGAIFNIQKLNSINAYYIKQMKDNEYLEFAKNYLQSEQIIKIEKDKHIYQVTDNEIDLSILDKALLLEKSRIERFSQLKESLNMFLSPDIYYDKKLLKWKELDDKTIKNNLENCRKLLADLEDKDFEVKSLEEKVFAHIKKQGIGNGDFLWPMRVALSGQKQSPSPFEIASALGKEISLKRLEKAINML